MNKGQLYNDYSSYIKKIFGARVQKISIDAGFTCPNIDGSKSTGGCIYCDNNAFNPYYCKADKSILQQIDEGISFFAKKYFNAYSSMSKVVNPLRRIFYFNDLVRENW